MGDVKTAESITRLIELVSEEEERDGMIKYKDKISVFGFIDYDAQISPLGDAILLYCETIKEWDNRYIK